jgi:hypothetical protein
MLLRIIDIPASVGKESSIKIVLQDDVVNESFETESYLSPITANYRKAQSWYYTDYPQTGFAVEEAIGIVDKTIKCGQLIGEQLLGEDYQLTKIRETIEERGYEFLNVQIESTRSAFFEEYWETTILHESKYVLSAVVKSFQRLYIQKDFPAEYPELRYDLKVSLAPENSISQLLQQESVTSSVEETAEMNEPLRVLTIISRPSGYDLPFESANSINQSLDSIDRGGIVDYEIHQLIDIDQLMLRISDKDNPIHIVHYDGPAILEDNQVSVVLPNQIGENSLLKVAELCQVMVQNKVAVLSFDAREYHSDNKNVSAGKGLAQVAMIAQQCGLGNVIGLEHITNPWSSGACFGKVYQNIAKGLSMGQSVVEARKELQAEVESTLMTNTPIAFHPWPLLIHYAKQNVIFFESNQMKNEPVEHNNSMAFQSRLFGFYSEMLPPLVARVSDGKMNFLLSQFSQDRKEKFSRAAMIIGKPGSGKSHFAHSTSLYLAQKRMIDFGFYFDFSKHSYSRTDLLEMIAPVLKLDPLNTDNVEAKLSSLKCCFVFDDYLEQQFSQSDKTMVAIDMLEPLIDKLLEQGHLIIMTGATEKLLPESSSFTVNLEPMLLVEQKILAAQRLKQFQPGEYSKNKDRDESWDSLLISLQGHPWLTKKITSLLKMSSVGDLTKLVSEHIEVNSENKIQEFYQWQWSNLSPELQKLLLLCVDSRGLLFEMLMVACDQQQHLPLATSFFTLLGNPELKLSEAIDHLESTGFLKSFPHGRLLDERCLDFLLSQAASKETEHQLPKQLKMTFSQIVCEGIRILVQHLIKQPNPSISNNLLLNRRSWVLHFERLWFNHDFKGFMQVKSSFEQFLTQAKLGTESKAWSLDLLQRTPVISADDSSELAKFGWLVLANSVLDVPESSNIEQTAQGFEVWLNWFNSTNSSIPEKELGLFQQAVSFLENYAIGQSNWSNCLLISEKSCVVYWKYEAWPRVIQSLKSQARYHYEMGNKELALDVENKIMNEIPYDEAPSGFQSQHMLDIILARLSRADSDNAQIILDQLKQSDSAARLSDMLEGLQSDIHFQREDYSAALPYYCKVWERALQADLKPQIEQLVPRMIEFEQKLGRECFNELFEQEVSAGVKKPRECTPTVH